MSSEGGENLVVNNPLANFGKIWPEQQKRSSSAERVLTENLRGLKELVLFIYQKKNSQL